MQYGDRRSTVRRVVSGMIFAAQDGDVLKVKDKGKIGFYDVLGFIELKEDKELTVELPASFTGSLEIEARDELVRVYGAEGLESLSVETTIGPIEITSVEALDYQLSSKGGNISLHGVGCGLGMSAETNNGNIDCLFVGDETWYPAKFLFSSPIRFFLNLE